MPLEGSLRQAPQETWLFMCLHHVGFVVGCDPISRLEPISGHLPDDWQGTLEFDPGKLRDSLTAGAYSLLRFALGGKPGIGRGGSRLLAGTECASTQEEATLTRQTLNSSQASGGHNQLPKSAPALHQN